MRDDAGQVSQPVRSCLRGQPVGQLAVHRSARAVRAARQAFEITKATRRNAARIAPGHGPPRRSAELLPRSHLSPRQSQPALALWYGDDATPTTLPAARAPARPEGFTPVALHPERRAGTPLPSFGAPEHDVGPLPGLV